MSRVATAYTTPAIALLSSVEAQLIEGESVIEGARRLLTNEALALYRGRQDLSAARLGVSRRVVAYYAQKYAVRPKDQKASS
jgi:hypothetical protein